MRRLVRWISRNFWPLLPALVGLLAIGFLAAGCGAVAMHAPWPLAPRMHGKGARPSIERPVTAAAPVEEALHARGLRFGTDGSVGALYAYATSQHERVDPRRARAGDLVFFDTTRDGSRCGTHVGVVAGVAPGGALKFREWRQGTTRDSFADPMRPQRRRDEQGRVINSFLRARTPSDDDGTRYYAGEMLCAVVRVR